MCLVATACDHLLPECSWEQPLFWALGSKSEGSTTLWVPALMKLIVKYGKRREVISHPSVKCPVSNLVPEVGEGSPSRNLKGEVSEVRRGLFRQEQWEWVVQGHVKGSSSLKDVCPCPESIGERVQGLTAGLGGPWRVEMVQSDSRGHSDPGKQRGWCGLGGSHGQIPEAGGGEQTGRVM